MDEKICLCRGISASRIIDSIKKGAHTVEAVKESTGATAGGCCGFRCREKIEELIEENK